MDDADNNSSSIATVITPGPKDVLSAVHRGFTNHAGNNVYRDLISENASVFCNARRNDPNHEQVRTTIVHGIVGRIETCGGRFLQLLDDENEGRTTQVWRTLDLEAVNLKVRHALIRAHKILKKKQKNTPALPLHSATPDTNDEDNIVVSNPRLYDMLPKRGNFHEGNIFYRELVAENAVRFRDAGLTEKAEIVKNIVLAIEAKGGRFLSVSMRQQNVTQARAKVRQALYTVLRRSNNSNKSYADATNKAPKILRDAVGNVVVVANTTATAAAATTKPHPGDDDDDDLVQVAGDNGYKTQEQHSCATTTTATPMVNESKKQSRSEVPLVEPHRRGSPAAVTAVNDESKKRSRSEASLVSVEPPWGSPAAAPTMNESEKRSRSEASLVSVEPPWGSPAAVAVVAERLLSPAEMDRKENTAAAAAAASSRQNEIVQYPRNYDVLPCRSLKHFGNIYYRQLIKENADAYRNAAKLTRSKELRKLTVQKVLDLITIQSNGRFLQRRRHDGGDDCWSVLPRTLAARKVEKALRFYWDPVACAAANRALAGDEGNNNINNAQQCPTYDVELCEPQEAYAALPPTLQTPVAQLLPPTEQVPPHVPFEEESISQVTKEQQNNTPQPMKEPRPLLLVKDEIQNSTPQPMKLAEFARMQQLEQQQERQEEQERQQEEQERQQQVFELIQQGMQVAQMANQQSASSESIQNQRQDLQNTTSQDPKPQDVLLGRGWNSCHDGNKFFLGLIRRHAPLFHASSTEGQSAIVAQVFDLVTTRGGRFLEIAKTTTSDDSDRLKNTSWYQISHSEAKDGVRLSLQVAKGPLGLQDAPRTTADDLTSPVALRGDISNVQQAPQVVQITNDQSSVVAPFPAVRHVTPPLEVPRDSSNVPRPAYQPYQAAVAPFPAVRHVTPTVEVPEDSSNVQQPAIAGAYQPDLAGVAPSLDIENRTPAQARINSLAEEINKLNSRLNALRQQQPAQVEPMVTAGASSTLRTPKKDDIKDNPGDMRLETANDRQQQQVELAVVADQQPVPPALLQTSSQPITTCHLAAAGARNNNFNKTPAELLITGKRKAKSDSPRRSRQRCVFPIPAASCSEPSNDSRPHYHQQASNDDENDEPTIDRDNLEHPQPAVGSDDNAYSNPESSNYSRHQHQASHGYYEDEARRPNYVESCRSSSGPIEVIEIDINDDKDDSQGRVCVDHPVEAIRHGIAIFVCEKNP